MSVTVRSRLPSELAAQFAEVCRCIGLNPSVVIRMLVGRWTEHALRERAVVLTLDEAAESAKEEVGT